MLRKSFSLLLTIGWLTVAAISASAQTGELRGHVKLKQADGTSAPMPGAVIDIFRTDISGKWDTKTDKKGTFVFAGLPYVGDFIIAVSGPGAQPNFQNKVKVGRDIDYELVLDPGDGRRLTLAEINTILKGEKSAGGSTATGDSGGEKAKKSAEMDAKNKELAEKNKKIDEANKTIGDKWKLGNAALAAGETANKGQKYAEADKMLTEAIGHYDEGIAADPTHPGIPMLMTNKAQALMDRAVAKYNGMVTSEEYKAAVKAGGAGASALLDPARKDWKESADVATKAVEKMKSEAAPTDPTDAANFTKNKYFALMVRNEAMNRVVTKVDPTQVDAGVVAYDEYAAVETDAVKKAKAERDMAKMLFDANAYDKAKQAYEKILAQNPDDADSLQNIGLILYNLGFVKEAEGKKDEAKANYQEAANYLARFVEKAPDGQIKTEAQAILTNLKEQQNVQAEKSAAPARRRRP